MKLIWLVSVYITLALQYQPEGYGEQVERGCEGKLSVGMGGMDVVMVEIRGTGHQLGHYGCLR